MFNDNAAELNISRQMYCYDSMSNMMTGYKRNYIEALKRNAHTNDEELFTAYFSFGVEQIKVL